MDGLLDQCYAIKFREKRKKTEKESHDMLNVIYADNVTGRSGDRVFFSGTSYFERAEKMLKTPNVQVCPSTLKTDENLARVKVLLDRDRKLNGRMISDEPSSCCE